MSRGVFGALVMVLGACTHPPSRTARTPGTTPAVRVMTYNVNYGIPGDPPTIAAMIAGRADAIFLQETTPAWEEALRAAAEISSKMSPFGKRCGSSMVAMSFIDPQR